MMEKLIPFNQHEEDVSGDFAPFDEGNVHVLPPSFIPGKWDVICQRGKECFEHGMLILLQRLS